MAQLPAHIIAQVALVAQPMLCGKTKPQGYRWSSERVSFNGTDNSPGTGNKEMNL